MIVFALCFVRQYLLNVLTSFAIISLLKKKELAAVL